MPGLVGRQKMAFLPRRFWKYSFRHDLFGNEPIPQRVEVPVGGIRYSLSGLNGPVNHLPRINDLVAARANGLDHAVPECLGVFEESCVPIRPDGSVAQKSTFVPAGNKPEDDIMSVDAGSQLNCLDVPQEHGVVSIPLSRFHPIAKADGKLITLP